jgi:hypothetical protein
VDYKRLINGYMYTIFTILCLCVMGLNVFSAIDAYTGDKNWFVLYWGCFSNHFIPTILTGTSFSLTLCLIDFTYRKMK